MYPIINLSLLYYRSRKSYAHGDTIINMILYMCILRLTWSFYIIGHEDGINLEIVDLNMEDTGKGVNFILLNIFQVIIDMATTIGDAILPLFPLASTLLPFLLFLNNFQSCKKTDGHMRIKGHTSSIRKC